ncbi:hypothetical protein Pmar_PMAR002461 [Perkinsus marinus ATCC 50983]|uniref:C2H2-type domain-containing protein n=1 Tax=Perkinsus marinus (strain ATCC 50983 / TXsc) TaxID=423536 RepID=C5KS73_PERM5|nr:hypothetical protein Pmar_PMAR002461 [Perkinsus marinus ATCC 50983]EER12654.1 hypothetical protein Pmar_PMAR002461 [Perkinsus marinus ATCC 50983]|eukprot:XP_002780859.1 hypothetical protein Pmar_PMAR002461 [Perkinsus marinus ATCC 50983]
MEGTRQNGFFIGRNSAGLWECGLCHTSVCYEGMLEDHIRGKQHAKNLRNLSWEKSADEGSAAPIHTSSNISTPSIGPASTSRLESASQALSWRNDPQYTGYREFMEQCHQQFYPDCVALTSLSVIPPLAERSGTVWGEAPAMDDGWDTVCKLCDAQLSDWYQWAQHMQGRKHRDNVKASRWSFAQFWQRLTAGKFPYYYEHLTGIWCIDPPIDPFPASDVYIETLRQNTHEPSQDTAEDTTEALGPSRAGSWE